MSNQEHLDNLSHIKDLMNKSSRFLSLSGLSGIMAGIYALVGAAIAYYFVFPTIYNNGYYDNQTNLILFLILAAIAFASVVTAYILSARKAKKNNEKIWDATTIRLLVNFLIPMAVGGIYILIKLYYANYGFIEALMLIFYGLALVNASKYTLGNIKFLGYGQIIIGLLCAAIPGYGFWFWVLGFGVFHIIYGALMYAQEKG